MGRLGILSVNRRPGTRCCALILMVIEGSLKVGASIEFESRYIQVLAMARPSYLRRQAEKVTSDDLLDVAREGETIEALVDMSFPDSSFMDMFYHDFDFN